MGIDGAPPFITPPRGRSLRERTKARLILAGGARDATELREWLDMTGLWPSQDGAANPAEVPVVWGSDYIRRRSKRIPGS